MPLLDTIVGHLRAARTENLPERIRDAVIRQQDQSEILIGWVQLAVVIVFAALYLVAPAPVNAEVGFDPVPYVLGVYFAFTILRLLLAHRYRLPALVLALSVILDMALLMVTIWSFHIKYMQPPSFYLKAPTLLYIFIFIALRALRFQANYVLLAGLTAVLGWLTLVAYALSEGGLVTRDYIDYMTSNTILLGAEFDKVISIAVVTLILAFAITRARVMLIGAVVKETEARELSRFFDADVARQITDAETKIEAGQGVIREGAVVMVDIRGFTILAGQLPARDLMQVLGEYQARIVPTIQDAGGIIDKFMGDGIMATFGAARPSATAAADALRAVQAICEEAAHWARDRAAKGQAPISVGASVAAGPLLFGAVGDETRLEYTVIGDPVNVAAKLEKQNKVEGSSAITNLATYELAKAQGYRPAPGHEILRDRRLEGVEEPQDLVVLVRPVPQAESAAAPPSA
ncbi:MAG: adenylate/guanylate cyclase domain-containing protein [Alphaproteobacteria bacterium]|nr:adenylate/guanylate cyclase domain-containing protein [Alphaproteobacteria bacterium]